MANRTRVLILTAAAGLGHKSVAEAIATAAIERYGDRCRVEIANPLDDRRVPAALRESQSDYDQIVRTMPELYKLGYGITNVPLISTMLENAVALGLFGAIRSLLRRYGPDVIVTTYPLYQSALSAVYALDRRRTPLVTVVTDLVTIHDTWFSKGADLCLVPTEAARDLALRSGIHPEKVEVSGMPVYPGISQERREPAEIRRELSWRNDLFACLAVGSKRASRFEDALRVLNHANLPVQLAIVAGDDDQLYQRLDATEWHVPTYLYAFVTNMPTLMRAADWIVCKAGGVTVSEALASGLPLLMVDILPGQELGNAEYVVSGAAGEQTEDAAVVLEVVYHWLDDNGRLLKECARNARRLGRPCAAYVVAERAWALATGAA